MQVVNPLTLEAVRQMAVILARAYRRYAAVPQVDAETGLASVADPSVHEQ